MTLGVLFALVAGLTWGTSAVIVRTALRHLPNPTLGTLVSIAAGGSFLMAVALIWYPQEIFNLSLLALPWFALIGFLNNFLGRRFNFMSVQKVGVSRAAPIIGVSPLAASLLAVLFAGESLTIPLLLGIFAVVGGVILITRSGGSREGTGGQHQPIAGYALAAGAALCYAAGTVIVKMTVRELAPPVVTAAFALSFGGIFLSLSLAPTLPRQMPILRNSLRGVALFACSGVLVDLALTSMYTALTLAPVVVVSPITSASPLVALTLSYFFLKQSERITSPVVIGALFIVGGVVLVSLSQALMR